MTDLTPIECEARLVGLSKQRRKDGDWVEVKFHIHPDDHPAALFILPLGTQCMLGVKGVPEKPDETTTAEEKPKGGAICKRAVLLCKRPEFQRWIALHDTHGGWLPLSEKHVHRPVTQEGAKAYLYRACLIESRRELDHDQGAKEKFERIEREFWEDQQGRTDDAYQAMADRR